MGPRPCPSNQPASDGYWMGHNVVLFVCCSVSALGVVGTKFLQWG